MRTITTTYYEAFDRTRFDNENECIDYENNVEGLNDIILGTRGENPKSTKSCKELKYLSVSCECLYFRSKKALDLCVRFLEHNNINSTGLNCTHTLYKWESSVGKWVPIIETLETEMVKMLDLERAMATFKN